ncbi:uncharacterized protein LOC109846342 [Asparagus officinalis]|uniref:uncharacterized protein LOC109846342 n=1 Tax=Asparagus officinalis TaxID=4686 RepID=UPI00098E4EB7|nr:uncharacterized protein LOC109846342 [Asparagus officinalis]
MVLLVYVDDIILAGNNHDECTAFKRYLHECFHIKDLGSLKFFLGIEVARLRIGISLCQKKYALDILAETGLLGSNPAETPMKQGHKLALAEGKEIDGAAYRQLVCRLIYLTITRLEISYLVHVLSQFAQVPRKEYFEAAMRVVGYIKGSPGQGILLRSNCDLRLGAYYDSDWVSCPITRRLVSGYFITIRESPISWKMKKQSTVSRLSAEVEYRAMAAVMSELVWLKSLLTSFLVDHRQLMELFCDNQSAIHIVVNPVFHEQTKHFEIDCHFFREQVQTRNIVMAHIRSQFQPADIFTKALARQQFHFLLGKLGIHDVFAPT